jgi:hypothetical protein
VVRKPPGFSLAHLSQETGSEGLYEKKKKMMMMPLITTP